MNERLLQFIWQNKLFHFSGLKTVHNEPVSISSVGVLNYYDGPDFYDARLTIDDLKWVGTVEIHCKDTEWLTHGHETDERYNSVILHVVWEVASEITVPRGVPCLILKDYVDTDLLFQYNNLMGSSTHVLCSKQLEEVENLIKVDAVDQAVYHRLRRKASELKIILEDLNSDWQQLFFYLLATALGKKANKVVMADLAKRLPVKYLLKHADSTLAVESMIYGVAGFLENPEGEYAISLANEYKFYAKKYGLKSMSALRWNNSKVRGLARPALSLAFLSSFIPVYSSKSQEEINPRLFSGMLLNKYWQEHHGFTKKSKSNNRVTPSFREHLVINVLVPFFSIKGLYYDDYEFFEKASNYLSQCKKESNSIISRMEEAGFCVEDASSSQGVIELHNEYCLKKKCLDCRVGTRILGRK